MVYLVTVNCLIHFSNDLPCRIVGLQGSRVSLLLPGSAAEAQENLASHTELHCEPAIELGSNYCTSTPSHQLWCVAEIPFGIVPVRRLATSHTLQGRVLAAALEDQIPRGPISTFLQ